MNEIYLVFEELNNKLKSTSPDSGIDSALLSKATFLIKSNLAINGVGDAFVLFSAFNYLNYAVKIDKSIGYWFKRSIEKYAIDAFERKINISFFVTIDKQMPILYVAFYNFIFSFHCISFMDSHYLNVFKNEPEICFDGIRKQQYAIKIFKFAISLQDKLNKLSSSNSNHTNQSNFMPPQYNGGCNLKFDYYEKDNIIHDFHLDFLVTTKTSRDNIALTISHLYFYKDLISNCQLPFELEKTILRDILINSYSVIECLEIEVGAKLKGEICKKGTTKSQNDKIQAAYRKTFNNHFAMSKNTKQIYDQYRIDRNNVHLTKDQSILTDECYTKETIKKYMDFLLQYSDFIYKNL